MKTQVKNIKKTCNKAGQTVGLFIINRVDGENIYFKYIDNFEIGNLQDLLLDEANFSKNNEIEYLGEGVELNDVCFQDWEQTESSLSFTLKTFEWDWEGDEDQGTYREWKVWKNEHHEYLFSFCTKGEFFEYARNFNIECTKNNPEFFGNDVYHANSPFFSGTLYVPKCMG